MSRTPVSSCAMAMPWLHPAGLFGGRVLFGVAAGAHVVNVNLPAPRVYRVIRAGFIPPK